MAEIISCPSCQRKLQVPETFYGQTVQCPECRQTFTAQPPPTTGVQPPPALLPLPLPLPPAPPPADPPRRRPRFDTDYDDEDDDFDIDARERRPGLPHRGGAILALGILGVVLCGMIFGPIAWTMGSTDLAAIRQRRMDPSGEGLVQAGRILGIVATIKGVLEILYFCGICGVAIYGH